MNLGLEGRKALVTGSSAGIGAAIARVLAREGMSVVLAARHQERLEQVASDIRSRQPQARLWIEICDVSRSEQLAELAQRHPDIDLLVNNAGEIPSGDSWRSTKYGGAPAGTASCWLMSMQAACSMRR